MLKYRIVRSIGLVGCGLLLGLIFMSTMGLTKAQIEPGKELIKPGVFGDIRAFIAKASYPDVNGVLEVLTICKGKYPFLVLTKDNSGNISKLIITDGMDRELIRLYFENDRISEFFLLDNEEKPVFTIDASKEPGVWQKARYMPCVKIDKPFKTYVDYMPVGEHYRDFDFDGHFDAKTVYNRHGDIVSLFICVKDEWQEVCKYNFDELVLRPRNKVR